MARSFAFFDLDHTLLPFDTQSLFCNFNLRRARGRTVLLAPFFPFALLRALGLVRTITVKRAFLAHLAGMTRDTLLASTREFAERVVNPWIYSELRAAIEEHRRAGRILVLNTASPDLYAGEISRVLGFDHCIATRFEITDPMPLMPRALGRNNKHAEKIERMKTDIPEFAAADAPSLAESWSYSDSAADLPLLEIAGHPVLVHPRGRLAALGRERGWRILRPPRPYATIAGDIFCSLRQGLGLYDAKVHP